MPPEMAQQAERLAKKENRTMSELMREAFRRYQQPPAVWDVREYIRQIEAVHLGHVTVHPAGKFGFAHLGAPHCGIEG